MTLIFINPKLLEKLNLTLKFCNCLSSSKKHPLSSGLHSLSVWAVEVTQAVRQTCIIRFGFKQVRGLSEVGYSLGLWKQACRRQSYVLVVCKVIVTLRACIAFSRSGGNEFLHDLKFSLVKNSIPDPPNLSTMQCDTPYSSVG